MGLGKELDFFRLFGQINTPDGKDDFDVASSDAIQLETLDVNDATGAMLSAEALSAKAIGRYERLFTQDTTLILAELKLGVAKGKQVRVPESSHPWALLLCASPAMFLIKRSAVKSTK